MMVKGEKGNKGEQGIQGITGNDGAKGEQGIQGVTGTIENIITQRNWNFSNTTSNAGDASGLNLKITGNNSNFYKRVLSFIGIQNETISKLGIVISTQDDQTSIKLKINNIILNPSGFQINVQGNNRVFQYEILNFSPITLINGINEISINFITDIQIEQIYIE
jgi:hypothetical protein